MFAGDPVDEGLQPGPAIEAIGARQYQLRVVQRERRRIDATEVSLRLGDGGGIADAESVERFLRLAFELIENGTRRRQRPMRSAQNSMRPQRPKPLRQERKKAGGLVTARPNLNLNTNREARSVNL